MKIYYFDQSNTGMGHIPASTLAVDYSYNVTLSGDLLSLDSIQTPHLEFTLGQKYLFTQNDSTNAGYKLTFPYYDFSSQLWTDSTLGITPHGVPGRNDAYVLFTGDISANLRKYCLVNSTGNRVTPLDTPQITVTDISFGGSSTKAFSGLPFTVTFDNNFTSTSIYQIKNDSNTVISSGTIDYGTGVNVEITIDSANPSGTYFIGWEYGTDVSFEVEQLQSYKFTVQTNIFNDPVYAVYNTTDDVYYNQPNLSFSASNMYLIDLSSTITDGSYDLVFGTEFDNSSTIVDSSPYVTSSSANTIFLDLRSYTGDPLYYFDRAIANMGYKDISITDTLIQSNFTNTDVLTGMNVLTYTLSGNSNSFANGTYTLFASNYTEQYDNSLCNVLKTTGLAYDWHTKSPVAVDTYAVNNGLTYSGVYIELIMPYRILLTQSYIRNRSSTNYANTKEVSFLGSNDGGSTFYFIEDFTFATNTHPTAIFNSSNTEHYSTIRMVIRENKSGTLNTEMRFWSLTGDVYELTYDILYTVRVDDPPTAFILSDVSRPDVTFVSGQTYKFDQSDSSNTGEQIVFGYTIDDSNNIFTSANGVTVIGTPGRPGAYTMFEVPSSLTGTVYYYSANTSRLGLHPYAISVDSNSKTIGDTVTFTLVNRTNTAESYLITGVTSADLNGADISGSVSANTEVNLSYTIYVTNASMALTFGDASENVTISTTIDVSYSFAVQTNVVGDTVYAVYNTTDDVYYNQPDLSFSAPNFYEFDLSSSITNGNYILTFGTELDNNGTEASNYIYRASNKVYLDLSSYTGDPLYYFDRAIANMGYTDISITDTLIQSNFTNTDVLTGMNALTYTLSGNSNLFANGTYTLFASNYTQTNSNLLHDVLKTTGEGYDWQTISPFTVTNTYAENNGLTYSGVYIELIMPYRILLTQAYIQNRSSTNYANTKEVSFLGSNDGGSTFYFIEDFTFATNTNPTAIFNSSNAEHYSTIRMVIRENKSGSLATEMAFWSLTGDVYELTYDILYTVRVDDPPTAFILSDVSRPDVTFVSGQTYKFDQSDSSNTGEQIVFGYGVDDKINFFTSANGVTVVGTPGRPGAYTIFEVPDSLTGPVYYYSINTGSMGNS